MSELELYRQAIDDIDRDLAQLFQRRMHVVEEISEYKKDHGLAVSDPAREAEMVERNRRLISDPSLEPYYVRFLKHMLELSRSYQAQSMNGRES